MSIERQRFLRGMAYMAREERRKNLRPVLVHGRRAESSTDVTQLPVREVIRMRDPDTGNLFFTLGYSLLDGPDIVA